MSACMVTVQESADERARHAEDSSLLQHVQTYGWTVWPTSEGRWSVAVRGRMVVGATLRDALRAALLVQAAPTAPAG